MPSTASSTMVARSPTWSCDRRASTLYSRLDSAAQSDQRDRQRRDDQPERPGQAISRMPTPTTNVIRLTTRKTSPKARNRRMVARSVIARDSSWPGRPAVVEGDRQPLQVVVEGRPHGRLDPHRRPGRQHPPHPEQRGLDHAEREQQDRPAAHSADRSRVGDRAVDDLLDDQREGQAARAWRRRR